MFIFERLFGVGLFTIMLVATCLIQARYSNKKLFIYIYYFTLLAMAYFYVPHEGADLTRNTLAMKAYARLPLRDLLDTIKQSATPVAILFYHIVGKFQNDHVLPFTAALITLGLNFKLVQNSRDDFKANCRVIAITLFIFMARGLFLQSISNIRTIMSLSIASLAVYNEFVRGKGFIRNLILYLIAATIHAMGVVIFFYRILYLFIIRGENVKNMIRRTVIGIVLLWSTLIIGQRYINALTRKSINYYTSARAGEGYTYFWEGLLSAISLLLVFYIIVIDRKNEKIISKENKSGFDIKYLISFIMPLIIIDLISIVIEFNFYQRMSWFVHIASIPIYVKVLTDTNGTEYCFKTETNFIIISTIMLVLACVRGDLCSLKFFVL